ncbi:L-2-hydroxyglutarate oxidase [Elizabethkingia meningoseptica]|uniref:L-2-hydroxyglutarate oxidase n=1 Tax=Elizabethkingia meningoseptica TaxID=238 RepID=UPI0023B14259|nr:L-2-hydroxyglutarate oxidase [Elizabethkingia meningoseptica]MDE5438573.1 L-2-hydroxyglutarate oxidase [Elizabethkingia meningoseptica]MDE5507644.1 L-2-hydroxyglutarate oxidase [Elizabethkingia meningoseptica]MDE5516506.1 L-2-hydroxyglutarate oxidase [Elizabethkingia meningoseptica]MDE5526751.1 L-2-hydroxyglutarate oxidase [Elizabethkingia meningoseptica]MDE5530757.1 L-2-hydroxyglutarate oxidase [Elizabethkingia meningoseptica]
MNYDIVIVGAGLVGLATAYQAKLKNSDSKILILEKEKDVALHQSGHNSGVIHSGIYYKPGSLKATNCIEGYNSVINFAEKYGIKYDLCGKIIVATSQEELPLLDNIYKRGVENGLQNLKYLSRKEFREIEPHCEGIKAIKVPQTGIIDYPGVAKKIKELFEELGGEVKFNNEVKNISNTNSEVIVTTSQSEFRAKKLISCAGLYSDKITKMTNEKNDVIIIPFRGEYYKIKDEKKHLVKHLIYPVPDPNFPFLGVHFTRMIDGNIEAGPNAVLAFRKEGYKFFDFDFNETMQTLTWPGFRKIVAKYGKTGMGEVHRSLSKSAFTKALQKLMPEIQESDLVTGGAGVRAQACDRNGALIDDFDIVKNGNIIHVRNAPSPAATSCFAIGNKISELIQK